MSCLGIGEAVCCRFGLGRSRTSAAQATPIAIYRGSSHILLAGARQRSHHRNAEPRNFAAGLLVILVHLWIGVSWRRR